jgi:hypothetical protein
MILDGNRKAKTQEWAVRRSQYTDGKKLKAEQKRMNLVFEQFTRRKYMLRLNGTDAL